MRWLRLDSRGVIPVLAVFLLGVAAAADGAPGVPPSAVRLETRWAVRSGQEWLVQVSERHVQGADGSMTVRKLSVMQPDSGPRVLYERETVDAPLALFPSRDEGGNLIAVWVTGSAYTVEVLRATGGRVVSDLTAGSRLFPSVLTCPNGDDLIAIDAERSAADAKSFAAYTWRKGEFLGGRKGLDWREALETCR